MYFDKNYVEYDFRKDAANPLIQNLRKTIVPNIKKNIIFIIIIHNKDVDNKTLCKVYEECTEHLLFE